MNTVGTQPTDWLLMFQHTNPLHQRTLNLMESFSLCAIPPCSSSKFYFSALPMKRVISFTHGIQKKHFSTGLQLKLAEPLDRYIVDVMNQLRVLMWNCCQNITQQKNQKHEGKRKSWLAGSLGACTMLRGRELWRQCGSYDCQELNPEVSWAWWG